MTYGEYKAKEKGFIQFQENLQIQKEDVLLWQAAAIAGFSWGGNDFKPQEFWENRQLAKQGKSSQKTDEELAELAEEKGLIPPKI
jgi:hypothetical protein